MTKMHNLWKIEDGILIKLTKASINDTFLLEVLHKNCSDLEITFLWNKTA